MEARETNARVQHSYDALMKGPTVINRLRMGNYLEALSVQIRRRGDALALVDGSTEMSYNELGSEVTARASALLGAGVTPGDRIAFVAENSADFVITVLAVWQADAVPVTIYPSTSQADLTSTLVDADPVLVICDAHTEELARHSTDRDVPVACMGSSFAPDQVSRVSEQTPDDIRDRLALICYSSGTTSRPKAIMLSAESIENSTRTFGETWRMTASDVTLVCLPMAWLFGLTTASMTTLLHGGTVVSLRRAKPELVADAIQQHGVTFFPAVTTVLTKLAHYLVDAAEPPALTSLRFVVSGGEPRNERSFETLRKFINIPVHDNYCASEMQPLVTYDPDRDPEPRVGSAGRLVQRSEMRLVDAEGNDTPDGEIGEALTRGPGLMIGYWHDPELTAEALTADGWYRTKDLLQIDEDGYIYVVGRTSDMIIRGGSNVSPGEVEDHLRQHPSVLDVAVVGAPDPMYGEEVVAVLQLREGQELDSDTLKAFAASGLSGFKVPTRYIAVAQLPQNSTTGKVNRKSVKSLLNEGTSV